MNTTVAERVVFLGFYWVVGKRVRGTRVPRLGLVTWGLTTLYMGQVWWGPLTAVYWWQSVEQGSVELGLSQTVLTTKPRTSSPGVGPLGAETTARVYFRRGFHGAWLQGIPGTMLGLGAADSPTQLHPEPIPIPLTGCIASVN